MPFSPLLGNPKPQFFDNINNKGTPLVGGSVAFYAAGTNTPLDTYTTTIGDVINTNPVLLDNRGEPPEQINGTDLVPYKVVLADAQGAIIWTMDDIFSAKSTDVAGGPAAPLFLNKTVSISSNYTVATAVRGQLINVIANAVTVTLSAAALALDGFAITVANNGGGLVVVVAEAGVLINGSASAALQPGEFIILTSTTTEWNGPDYIRGMPSVAAAGTADAMTAAFDPPLLYTDEQVVQVTSVGAITTVVPTISFNGGVAKVIAKYDNQPLLLTDIASSNQPLLLKYFALSDRLMLLNPLPPPIPSFFRGAFVTFSIDQSIPDGGTPAVNWDVTVYDTDAIHNDVVNNSRLTVPANASKVQIIWTIWDIGGSLDAATILKNNATPFPGFSTARPAGTVATSNDSSNYTAIMDVVPGDYFEIRVTNISGVPLSIKAGSSYSWMSMHILE